MASPTVRVVIVVYNSKDYIAECLDSLRQSFMNGYQIVVVDNASEDGTIDIVASDYPEVIVKKNPLNYGFAEGNNVGLFEPIPEYAVFLNPDTTVAKDALESLVSDLANSESAGLAQAKVMLHDARGLLNSNGNEANYLMFGWPGGYLQPENPSEEVRRITFPSGCAFAMKRDALKSVKGFDSTYFMYNEDLDVGIRAFLLGWDTIYSPRSTVYHKYRYRDSSPKYYLLERNRLTTLLKVYRKTTLVLILPVIVVSECGVILKSIREGWLKEKFHAYFSAVLGIRHIVKERTVLQRRRRRTDRELMEILKGGLEFRPIGDSRLVRFGNVILDKYRQFLIGMRILDR